MTKTPKVSIPAPSMLHFRGGRQGISEEVYPDLEQFFDDLTTAYREEIADLASRAPDTSRWTTPTSPISAIPKCGSGPPPAATTRMS